MHRFLYKTQKKHIWTQIELKDTKEPQEDSLKEYTTKWNSLST